MSSLPQCQPSSALSGMALLVSVLEDPIEFHSIAPDGCGNHHTCGLIKIVTYTGTEFSHIVYNRASTPIGVLSPS